ncbi:MAG: hypothetical protein JNL74_04160 [Fibrobacteres bacterium]|nr:hypothetical protein [Fibrobacterota bacterium]
MAYFHQTMGTNNTLISRPQANICRPEFYSGLLFLVIALLLPVNVFSTGIQETFSNILSFSNTSPKSDTGKDGLSLHLNCEYDDIVKYRSITIDSARHDSLVADSRRFAARFSANWKHGNKNLRLFFDGVDMSTAIHMNDDYFTGFEGKQNRFIAGIGGSLTGKKLRTSSMLSIPLYERTTELSSLAKRINAQLSAGISINKFSFDILASKFSPPSAKLVPFLNYTAFEIPFNPLIQTGQISLSYSNTLLSATLTGSIKAFSTDTVKSAQQFSLNSNGYSKSAVCSLQSYTRFNPYITFNGSLSSIKTESKYGNKVFLGLDTLHINKARITAGGEFINKRLKVAFFHERLNLATDSGVADLFPFSSWASLFDVAYRIDTMTSSLQESGISLKWAVSKIHGKHNFEIGLDASYLTYSDSLLMREKQRLYLFFFTLGPYEGFTSGNTDKLWLKPNITYTWRPSDKWILNAGLAQHIPLDISFSGTSQSGNEESSTKRELSFRGGTIINFDLTRLF